MLSRCVNFSLYFLRTVPTFVTAHTFCASRDTRVSYGWCPLIQGYLCVVLNHAEKAEAFKKKIEGNHAFFRDNKASIRKKTPYIALYFTAFTA